MKYTAYSILRGEQYRRLKEISLPGRILDLGGSQKSGYHELINGKHAITTINIDATYGCDIVCDIQKPFPFENASFDVVIGLNILEHIYAFENVFKETNKVMKQGGTVVFSTPFMFNIHGSPDDYFRYTKSCFERLLKDYGFTDIVVDEIGEGVFSLFFQLCGSSIPTAFLWNSAKWCAIHLDRFFLSISGKYRTLARRIPLGYFVVARKA